MNRIGKDVALDAQFGNWSGCRLLLAAPETSTIPRYTGKDSPALGKQSG